MSKQKRRGTIAIFAGLLLLAAALFLSVYNLWDESRAAATASTALTQLHAAASPTQLHESPQTPDYILNPEMEMPTIEIDGQAYIGEVSVPSLGLNLPVLADWSYPKLKLAPCRYEGSAYKSGFVLAAHNYQTHFGPLHSIKIGDEVLFTDVDGNAFVYAVVELEALTPTDSERMTAQEWDLTLFTCTLSGRERFTVRCVRA